VRFILTRRNTRNGLAYREDPTILAWDLINEPRCETWKVSTWPHSSLPGVEQQFASCRRKINRSIEVHSSCALAHVRQCCSMWYPPVSMRCSVTQARRSLFSP